MSSHANPSRSSKRGMSPLTGKLLPVGKIRKLPRRTQAERLAETRQKILAATITYIDEQGFHQTSLHRVARAAGVTVGAVQHHFATKADLLAAVLEDSFQNLSFTLENARFEGAALADRVSLFVDHSWKHCHSPQYQSSLQVLLGMRKEAPEDFERWLNDTLGHVVQQGFELWLRIFKDIPFSETEHFDIMLYSFSSLSGIALTSRISKIPERVESDLRELKKLLLLRFNAAHESR